LERELREILARPSSIQVALSKIKSIRTKMLAHVPLRNGREMKISDAVYHDFVTLMRNHHPLIAVSVDISMKQQEAVHAMEARVKILQGQEKDLKPFDRVQEYRELVCSYLSTDIQNSPYPRLIPVPLLGSRAQMACLAPSVPSSNPVFVAGKKANNRPCHLCMAEGHWASQCMLYHGDQPGHQECPECGGLHTLPCRETQRAQVIQPVFARYRRRTEEWIRKKEEQKEEETTETDTETESEQEPEPGGQQLLPQTVQQYLPQPEQQDPQQHHQQEHRQEPPPPYWAGDGPRPRQRIEQWDRQQEEPRQAPQNTRYPSQTQHRRYHPRFNGPPNYYGNNRLFNPHSRNEGRGDTRLREDWQGNGPERRREGGYTYDNRRERTQEDQYSRDQPRSQARNPQAQERRQQEGITYQRNQQPVDGTLGNTGAQTPPTTAFISRINNKKYGHNGYTSDFCYPYHSYDRD
jgi:hypothetical protein